MAENYEPKPCGFPGIDYEHRYLRLMDQNKQYMAGAIGLPSTDKLWVLYFEDIDTKDLIKEWIEHRDNAFGTTGVGSQKMAIRPSILEYASNQEFHALITAPTRPTIGTENVTDKNISPLTYLWYMRKLIKAKPALFPRSNVDKIPLTLDSYDVIHGWKLLRTFWVHWKWFTIPKTLKSAARRAAVPPIYYRPLEKASTQEPMATQHTKSGDDTTKDSQKLFGMMAKDLTELHSELLKVPYEQTEDKDGLESHRSNTTQEVSSRVGNALCSLLKKRASRPKLSKEQRLLLIDHLLEVDNFSQECIIFEPDNTSVPDQLSSSQLIWQLAASASTTKSINPVDTRKETRAEAPNTDRSDGTTKSSIESLSAQAKVLEPSAQPPSFEQACATLEIDPNAPSIPPGGSSVQAFLEPWQVAGVAWMLAQEESAIKGGILADEKGLERTLTTLSLVWLASKQASELIGYLHRPTLIVCPVESMDTWQGEIRKRFGNELNVILLVGQGEYGLDAWWESRAVRNPDQLRDMLINLDHMSANTSRTIVLTTYFAWAEQTTYTVENDYKNGNTVSSLCAFQTKADEDVVFFNGYKINHYQTRIAGRFGRIIMDEGHRARKMWTRIHQSLSQLGAENVWFLTATPICDQALDLCGYVSMLYRGVFDNVSPGNGSGFDGEDDDPIEEYREWSNKTEPLEHPFPFHLLSLRRLVALATKGHLATEDGDGAVPIIMRLVCLRRTIDNQVDAPFQIDDSIPPCRIMTVEVRYPRRVQQEHDILYRELAARLHQRGAYSEINVPATETANNSLVMDEEVLQRLCHLGLLPRLDQFVQNVGNSESTLSQIEKYVEREDCGFSLFYAHTCKDPAIPIPEGRLAQAHYLATDSPKLRYLAKIMRHEGAFNIAEAGPLPSFLIITRWPLIQWLVEMFMDALSVKCLIIRPSMSPKERIQTANHFMNKVNNYQVLITTFDCGDLGSDLHQSCARVIVLEPALDLDSAFQTISQIHRPGQREKQKVFIIFQDHTVSRYLEYRNMTEALPQLGTQVREVMQRKEDAATVPVGAPVSDIWTDQKICKLLGQPRSRLGFHDIEDLGYKPDDPLAPIRKRKGGSLSRDSSPKKARSQDESILKAEE